MEGRYNIIIEAPRRKEKGTVIFIVKGNTLSGTISAMGLTSKFYNGKIDGDKFEFTGEVRFLFKLIPYAVRGHIVGNNLHAEAKSSFGSFRISGEKYWGVKREEGRVKSESEEWKVKSE